METEPPESEQDFKKWLEANAVEVLKRVGLAEGQTVLDYGCGIGTQGLALAEAGAEVTLMDIEGPVWDYAQWRAEKHGLHNKVRWLPLAPILGEYGLVLCVDVIGHVPEPFRLLDELSDKARFLFLNEDFRIREREEDDRYPQHHQRPGGWNAALRYAFVNVDSFLWQNKGE